MIKIPQPIIEKLDELYELTAEYPVDIPVQVLAKFLGMGDASLRASMSSGSCSFGFGWTKEGKKNSAFQIPTVPFYLWYTQGIGYKQS